MRQLSVFTILIVFINILSIKLEYFCIDQRHGDYFLAICEFKQDNDCDDLHNDHNKDENMNHLLIAQYGSSNSRLRVSHERVSHVSQTSTKSYWHNPTKYSLSISASCGAPSQKDSETINKSTMAEMGDIIHACVDSHTAEMSNNINDLSHINSIVNQPKHRIAISKTASISYFFSAIATATITGTSAAALTPKRDKFESRKMGLANNNSDEKTKIQIMLHTRKSQSDSNNLTFNNRT